MPAINTTQTAFNGKLAEQFLAVISALSDHFGLSVPPIVEIDDLRSRPVGSFGRAWADNLDRNGLKPLTSGLRRQQLHDGLHVLTDYATDPLGEAEVQAFLLGAKFRWAHGVLALGLLRGWMRQYWHAHKQQPQSLFQALSETVWPRLWQAYLRGQNCLLDPDAWEPELLWDLPLEVVRDRFGLSQP